MIVDELRMVLNNNIELNGPGRFDTYFWSTFLPHIATKTLPQHIEFTGLKLLQHDTLSTCMSVSEALEYDRMLMEAAYEEEEKALEFAEIAAEWDREATAYHEEPVIEFMEVEFT